eukprot:gene13940-biopygen9605
MDHLILKLLRGAARRSAAWRGAARRDAARRSAAQCGAGARVMWTLCCGTTQSPVCCGIATAPSLPRQRNVSLRMARRLH